MLGCESGLIQEITSVGAFQTDSEADLNQVCQEQTGFDTQLRCPSMAVTSEFIKTSCLGKEACLLSMLSSHLPKECSLDIASKVYVQFKCIQSD